MITTHKLGNGGRLANQIMAYMSLTGFAKKHSHELFLHNPWEYSKYFNGTNDLVNGAVHYNCSLIREKEFHYTEYNELNFADCSLQGYFQSEKYWLNHEKEVRQKFSWNESEFSHLGKHGADGISIHIRRGDYVNNPSYAQLGINYYIQALIENFPDWQSRAIYIYSDDPAYCKLHFSSWNNFIISEGRSDIEDLYLMSQCKNLILSNSSYSWLGAYFAETQFGKCKVIRPVDHFAGNLAHLDIKDFYPDRWTPFKPKNKIDLKDVTFTIPVSFDHPDRKKNLALCVCMLQHYFDTNIMVCENNGSVMSNFSEHCEYYKTEYSVFHRTRMLNNMAKEAKTDFVANWDADVVIAPMQILKAVHELRNGNDMVYPYGGTFARVNRMPFFKNLESCMDVGILAGIKFKGMYDNDKKSFGGAVMWNRKRFLEAGGENENFISFGAEDYERYERASKLDYTICRVHGPLYHIDHFVGADSSPRNPYFRQNALEYEKVKGMSKQDLVKYIETWSN